VVKGEGKKRKWESKTPLLRRPGCKPLARKKKGEGEGEKNIAEEEKERGGVKGEMYIY